MRRGVKLGGLLKLFGRSGMDSWPELTLAYSDYLA